MSTKIRWRNILCTTTKKRVAIGNSYRFIIVYKSTYAFICLEYHINTEINLDLRVSNILGYSAAER